MFDISMVLSALATDRPAFCSEADFQHALAWKIHEILSDAKLRLELPVSIERGTAHIDIVVQHNNASLAIEIKYKTRATAVNAGGEQFKLTGQGAQNLGRYDFFKDIQRLETVSRARGWRGLAVFLTNDSAYWTAPRNERVGYAQFDMHEGRRVTGKLEWNAGLSEGTRKGREDPIDLSGSYVLRWTEYPSPASAGHIPFRYLALEVAEGRTDG